MQNCKFDNPLAVLLLFARETKDDHRVLNERLNPYRDTGRGDYFYRNIDISPFFEEGVLIEYLMGWLQMDYMQ